MNYRNDKIKKLCRGKRCTIKIPDVCLGNDETVVPAHSPDLMGMHGKSGMGVKAHDIFISPACNACHDVIDGRVILEHIDREARQWFFDRGHAEFLVDILRSGELKDAI